MDNFIFSENDISQHIIKYGVDIRPAVSVKQDKEKLQGYCNYLTEKFPEAFEMLLIGPHRVIVQKTFVASNDKRVELPTFAMTGRGPLYSFPVRFFLEDVEDFDIPEKDKIFRKALQKFRETFVGRKVVRVGVISEIIFDCGSINSVEVLGAAISKDLWKERIRNITIHLENPTDKYNVNVDVMPAYAERVVQGAGGLTRRKVGFGIMVKLDINNLNMAKDLDNDTIAGVLAFAEDYVPEKLVKFLNNERE